MDHSFSTYGLQSTTKATSFNALRYASSTFPPIGHAVNITLDPSVDDTDAHNELKSGTPVFRHARTSTFTYGKHIPGDDVESVRFIGATRAFKESTRTGEIQPDGLQTLEQVHSEGPLLSGDTLCWYYDKTRECAVFYSAQNMEQSLSTETKESTEFKVAAQSELVRKLLADLMGTTPREEFMASTKPMRRLANAVVEAFIRKESAFPIQAAIVTEFMTVFRFDARNPWDAQLQSQVASAVPLFPHNNAVGRVVESKAQNEFHDVSVAINGFTS